MDGTLPKRFGKPPYEMGAERFDTGISHDLRQIVILINELCAVIQV